MRRFITLENIKHFRDLLWRDNLAPIDRACIQRLLIDEEDKLARDTELLGNLEQHIKDGRQRIAEQCLRVERMQRDGHSGAARAQALLDGMIESQFLHMNYQCLVEVEIERNRL